MHERGRNVPAADGGIWVKVKAGRSADPLRIGIVDVFVFALMPGRCPRSVVVFSRASCMRYAAEALRTYYKFSRAALRSVVDSLI